MSNFRLSKALDKVFTGGILLKGASGLFELISGFALFFVNPADIHRFISFLTNNELLEDPHDKLAQYLLHATQHINTGSKTFAIAYLWIHAGIKLIAVIGILKNWLWAYPFSLITLGLLMTYQVVSISIKPSIGMILLTIFDAFILFLIWREYRKIRAEQAGLS
jgi:uncharacterized membrane protein